MHDALHWLTVPQRLQYKLAVTVSRCLQHRATRYLADYCLSVSARRHQLSVPRICHRTSESHTFSVADQQSGIHCQMVCGIQLSTPIIFVRTSKHLFTGHYRALAH